MSKSAIVLGASGYIGSAVAVALRRDGFRVTAIVRQTPCALQNTLEQNGVIVQVGKAGEPSTYEAALATAQVVVDATTADMSNPTAVPRAVLEAMEAHSAKNGERPSFLYCSGVLVQGETPRGQVAAHEGFPKGPKRSVWRGEVEDLVLGDRRPGSSLVNRVVLRPGFVYGGHGGGLAKLYFETSAVEGDPTRRLSWIHVDDVGSAFVRAAQLGNAVDRQAFNIVEEGAPTWGEAREAMYHAAGNTGPLASRPATDGEGWLNVNIAVTARKARDVMGWAPTHAGPTTEARESFIAYKAHH